LQTAYLGQIVSKKTIVVMAAGQEYSNNRPEICFKPLAFGYKAKVI
jgi:hypothetical protein